MMNRDMKRLSFSPRGTFFFFRLLVLIPLYSVSDLFYKAERNRTHKNDCQKSIGFNCVKDMNHEITIGLLNLIRISTD